MRLLEIDNNGRFRLKSFHKDATPPYAILSHTWEREDDEVSYRDIVDDADHRITGYKEVGYRKLEFCGRQTKEDGLHWFWVDTCCIDKSSSAELTKAINLMFKWYQKAARCYVYLSDVSLIVQDGASNHREWNSPFRNSRWFTRGWTLQELLAPTIVVFYSREGARLGDKSSLAGHILDNTGVSPEAFLLKQPLSTFSIEERFSWTDKRQTSEEEDMAYCLLGIFDVSLPLIYGEGRSNVIVRLRRAIKERSRNAEELPAGRSLHYLELEREQSDNEQRL